MTVGLVMGGATAGGSGTGAGGSSTAFFFFARPLAFFSTTGSDAGGRTG
jgi:hypothetical protein